MKFVTCSGVNETTDVDALMKLLSEFPMAEIAVQVSKSKCLAGMPRYKWIHKLCDYIWEKRCNINAALHVNLQWAEDICQGIVAPELAELLSLYSNGKPIFSRIQLNVNSGCAKTPDIAKLVEVIEAYPAQRFIVPYSVGSREWVHELFATGVVFDCLYDDSFGRGVLAKRRNAPVFHDVVQGYAGGIDPDNVVAELNKICNAVWPYGHKPGVYIDAHKGLEDENTHLDLDKCRAYLSLATQWYKDYQETAVV